MAGVEPASIGKGQSTSRSEVFFITQACSKQRRHSWGREQACWCQVCYGAAKLGLAVNSSLARAYH